MNLVSEDGSSVVVAIDLRGLVEKHAQCVLAHIEHNQGKDSDAYEVVEELTTFVEVACSKLLELTPSMKEQGVHVAYTDLDRALILRYCVILEINDDEIEKKRRWLVTGILNESEGSSMTEQDIGGAIPLAGDSLAATLASMVSDGVLTKSGKGYTLAKQAA